MRHLFPLWCFALAPLFGGTVEVQIEVEPLPEEFRALEPLVRLHLLTAARDWISRFEAADCSLEIAFDLRPWPARGAGRSVDSASVGDFKVEGRQLTQEGAAFELRTGRDPNGDKPDIEIYFDPGYFRTLWFDPDPQTRRARLPRPNEQRLDAYSVILHEFGHAFGFNGYRDPGTGELPGGHLSAYDRWVGREGKHFFFNGPQAQKVYGGPVPLSRTITNYHHLGEPGRAGEKRLRGDLMNGFVLEWSRRYEISPLDLAILADCGLKLRATPPQAETAAGAGPAE